MRQGWIDKTERSFNRNKEGEDKRWEINRLGCE
jgi:hypothetical protein